MAAILAAAAGAGNPTNLGFPAAAGGGPLPAAGCGGRR